MREELTTISEDGAACQSLHPCAPRHPRFFGFIARVALLLLFQVCSAAAQLQILPAPSEQALFGGGTGAVQVVFRNPGQLPIELALKTRLFQLSSSTVMPSGNSEPWKRLAVLGGQTVLESVRLEFPSVRAVTKFDVRWLDEMEKTVGHTYVTVFPTNFLTQLVEVAGEKPPGIFDPHAQLGTVLRALRVEFVELAEGERIETFRERLAILGPFDPKQPAPSNARKHASMLAARGVNVVLVSGPPAEPPGSARRTPPLLRPVVMTTAGPGRLVLVPHAAVSGLSTNPLAQEALLQAARLATNPNLITEAAP